jgi:hypothetical protein
VTSSIPRRIGFDHSQDHWWHWTPLITQLLPLSVPPWTTVSNKIGGPSPIRPDQMPRKRSQHYILYPCMANKSVWMGVMRPTPGNPPPAPSHCAKCNTAGYPYRRLPVRQRATFHAIRVFHNPIRCVRRPSFHAPAFILHFALDRGLRADRANVRPQGF